MNKFATGPPLAEIAVRVKKGAYITRPLKFPPWLDAESDVDFDTAMNHGMFPSSGRAVRVQSFGKFGEITSTFGLIVCPKFGNSSRANGFLVAIPSYGDPG